MSDMPTEVPKEFVHTLSLEKRFFGAREQMINCMFEYGTILLEAKEILPSDAAWVRWQQRIGIRPSHAEQCILVAKNLKTPGLRRYARMFSPEALMDVLQNQDNTLVFEQAMAEAACDSPITTHRLSQIKFEAQEFMEAGDADQPRDD